MLFTWTLGPVLRQILGSQWQNFKGAKYFTPENAGHLAAPIG